MDGVHLNPRASKWSRRRKTTSETASRDGGEVNGDSVRSWVARRGSLGTTNREIGGIQNEKVHSQGASGGRRCGPAGRGCGEPGDGRRADRLQQHEWSGLLHGQDSCSGVLTTGSSASYIDVADDLTSCVDNATDKQYNGMNVVGLIAYEVFSFSEGSWTYALGGANDIIDHFDED